MGFLLASLAVLAAGPVLHHLSLSRPRFRSGLDGFTFVAIAGLVLFHLLPECFAKAGWPTLVAVATGLFGPRVFERFVRGLAGHAHRFALFLALVGLVLHAVLDGVALDHEQGSQALALAVLIHRLPAAIAVWWLLRPYGSLVAGGALGALGVATVFGYFTGHAIWHHDALFWPAIFQALMAGSLLHVVAHRPPGGPALGANWRWAAGFGGLAGLALIFGLPHPEPVEHVVAGEHHHEASHVGSVFLELAFASAPALVLAYLVAGLVQAFLPKASVGWLRRGGPVGQSLRGTAFGLPLPICSCGVVPLYRGLVRRGAPVAAAMAFLVATPEIGLDAIFLSMPLLGTKMTVLRIGVALLVAIVVGFLMGRTEPDTAVDVTSESDASDDLLDLAETKWEAFRRATTEIIDSTLPWIVFGLALAAFVEPILSPEWIARIPGGLEVPLLALLGLPLYVCASGATPLVAMLIANGVSPGAALAFLLTGPATNVTTFGLLSKLHGTRFAMRFVVLMVVLTIGLGFVVNMTVSPGDISPVELADHEHGHDEDHEHSIFAHVMLGALGVLVVLSLLRQGPRDFVGQIVSWTRLDDAHDHDHDGDAAESCCH